MGVPAGVSRWWCTSARSVEAGPALVEGAEDPSAVEPLQEREGLSVGVPSTGNQEKRNHPNGRSVSGSTSSAYAAMAVSQQISPLS